MKRYNIMTAKKYQKADGSQGTKWIKLGSIVVNQDGKMFGDLDCIPTGAWFDGSIQLFDADQQSNNGQANNYSNQGNNGQPQQQNSQYNQANNYGNNQQQYNNYGNNQR